MQRVVRVVFEQGVLKPLTPLRLKERAHFVATLYPEAQWRDEFERLRRRMRVLTRGVPQAEIETDITRARAEVKAKRRAAQRSA
jgi:predicted DNA-binding antitoxin AbrB/MazE fold protein